MALVRGLRWLLLAGLIALGGGIALTLNANARLSARPALEEEPVEPSLTQRIAQHGTNVKITRTHQGTPSLKVDAAESTTFTGGRLELANVVFRLMGHGGEETLVQAPEASSTANESAASQGNAPSSIHQGMGSWVLQGGVTVKTPEGGTLSTPTLAYFESEGVARTNERVEFVRGPATGSARGLTYEIDQRVARFAADVSASMTVGGMGRVRVEAARAVHDVPHQSFEMFDYRAVTERGETLTGARLVTLFQATGGIGRLEGDGGFVLESTHAIATKGPPSPLSKLLALEGLRTMRGQRLAVAFNDGNEPVSLEVVGDANVTAGGATGSPSASSIAAQTLVFDLTHGSLSRARAIGAVDLKGAAAEGESSGLHMRSENLEAEFDPTHGALLRLEGRGEIRVTDEGMESEGSHTALDPNSDIWVISGEEGSQATSTMPGRRIEARRIEADRRNRTLSARGGVRASYEPPTSAGAEEATASSALPFFQRGETVHAMAGSLTLSNEGHVAHYEEKVRLWQGENRVEAASIDVDETQGTLRAHQEVISSFRQPTPDGQPRPANPSDEIVTISAASMIYERAAHQIRYAGPVLVTQASMRLTSDALTVTLDAAGHSAETIEATGAIEMRDSGRTGTGDRLVVRLKENTLTLTGTGREAKIQDQASQQVVSGSSLTLDRSSDRILVESEMGGRTWITLKPGQKGLSDRAPDPKH